MSTESTQIIIRAIEHYQAGISTDDICSALDIDSVEFDKHFGGADDLWAASYSLFLGQATEAMDGLGGLKDADLNEKLSTLIFILLDVFEENVEYVDATFSRYASGFSSRFQKDLKEWLSNLLQSEDVPGANQFLFDNKATLFVLSESIVQMIKLWLKDDTEQHDKSIALIDRSVSLWSEILTSGVPQRSVELVKYGVEAGYLPIKDLPFVGEWFRDSSDSSEKDSGSGNSTSD
jgi:hypothetical protein